VHFCERQCTHEIDMHIRVKEGTVIDYEWLRSFVQLDKNRVVTNPKIVGYVVRGVLFTIGEEMTCPIPPDNYDILIHADGSWERCALVCPEDDVVQPYIDSLPKDVQATFEPEASAYWDNDHCSVHEAVRVSNSPLWAIE